MNRGPEQFHRINCSRDAELIRECFTCVPTEKGVSFDGAFLAYTRLCRYSCTKPVDTSSFSKLLRDIFPGLQSKRKKATSGESKTTFYTNLEVKWKDADVTWNKENLHTNESGFEAQKLIKQPVLDSLLDLEKLCTYFSNCLASSLKNKWIMSNANDHLSFRCFEEQLQMIDSIQVIRNVSVNKDLSWAVKVHGYNVPSAVFREAGVPSSLILASDLGVLLQTTGEKTQICAGCTNPEYLSLNKQCISQQGTLISISQTITDGLTSTDIKRSTCCQGLILKNTKRTKCYSCCKLNKILNNALLRSKHSDEGDNEQIRGRSKEDSSSHTNWRFLNEERKRLRHADERRRRLNAERREKYLKRKYESEKSMIRLTKSDSDDVKFMFNQLDKGVDSEDKELTFDDATPSQNEDAFYWKIQREEMQSGKTLWHPRFLEVCLRLWQRSKQGYMEFSDSGFIKLPSGRYLRKIKNRVLQTPGIQKDHLDWMCMQAVNESTTLAGRNGYIMFDEMSIQGDLQLRKVGDTFELCGLVRMGDMQDKIRSFSTGEGNMQAEMATHILQFTFVSIEGFEFPVAYYPTAQVDPITLFHLYWDIVCSLQEIEFFVHLGVCDGAQANRVFIMLHFDSDEDAINKKFTTINPYSGRPHSFMMDSSHNFKKIRNNLEKSSDSGKTPRHFHYGGEEILWKHWVDAYHYDTITNSISTFRRLSDDNFYLNSASRMRNYLADDVLGLEMMQVIQNYKCHLEEASGSHSVVEKFNKTLEFLTVTSTLLKNFKSKAPYRSLDDSRYIENAACLQWFHDWGEWVKKNPAKMTAKSREKMFISNKLNFDLSSMVLGFRMYSETLFSLYPGCEIKVNRTNQDNLEQFFGRQRAQNGQNNNPTELQYGSGVNGILRMAKLSISGGNSSKY